MNITEFNKFIGILKTVKRTGWVNNKIPHPESVAEHSFRTGILAMLLAKEMNVDALKSIKMALIHDVGESIIGDIVIGKQGTPPSFVQAKRAKERDAIKRIFSSIGNAGKEYVKLFDEYEENKSPEARFVKQLDKLEMAIQAYEYENKYGLDLEEFYESARIKIKDNKLVAILNGLVKMRKKK